MTPPIMLWAAAFAWTCAFEFPFYFGMLRGARPDRSALRLASAALIVQVVTHPVLWYVVPRFDPYWAWVTAAEIGVTTTEWLLVKLFAGVSWRHAAIAAITANTFSTLAGLLMVPWLAEAWHA